MAQILTEQQVVYKFRLTELTVEDMRMLESALGEFHDCHNGEFSPAHPMAMRAKELYRLIGNELRMRNI